MGSTFVSNIVSSLQCLSTVTETVKEMITICTLADPLSELEDYVDLDILPPCINPNGHGDAWPEFGPIVWQGGALPLSNNQTNSPRSVVTPSIVTPPRSKEKTISGTSPTSVVSLGVGGF